MDKTITDPKQFGRVAVMMGGSSAERAISLNSGSAVLQALLRVGVEAVAMDTADSDWIDILRAGSVDRVFNMLHGPGGEDGVLQGTLESFGIGYTGSGVLASALSMDKLRTKQCWHGLGLPTPRWFELRSEHDLIACADALGFPVIVKPATEGSSIGISRADDISELEQAWQVASQHEGAIFAEAWIAGSEYTVGILKNKPLPLIRLETPRRFYDYEAKYQASNTQYHCPCGLDSSTEQRVQDLAVASCQALGVEGWGRVDIMMSEEGSPWLIEVNTVPGMTDHSLVPMAAKAYGLSFEELVWHILETSFG
ncbi:MAG: D-alanine--D-alanine ligase [Methylococcaceae bacterium]